MSLSSLPLYFVAAGFAIASEAVVVHFSGVIFQDSVSDNHSALAAALSRLRSSFDFTSFHSDSAAAGAGGGAGLS